MADAFRPKAKVDNLSITESLPSGAVLEVGPKDWPYEPKSQEERTALSRSDLLTDRAEPNEKGDS